MHTYVPPRCTLAPVFPAAAPSARGELVAHGIGEHDVRGDVFVEEGRDAALGEVDELVDDHEVARRDLLAHGPDGADGHEVGRAELLYGADVRAEVDGVGRDAVPAAVAREKEEGRVPELAANDRVARRPVRSVDVDLFDVGEPVEPRRGHAPAEDG